MEAAVANVDAPGERVLVVVTGYFGDRLAQIFQRYGANVARIDVEWGRACDPPRCDALLAAAPADIVAVVHAETSTGVLNPVQDIARIAADAGALTVVDAVTSLGAMPLRPRLVDRRLLQLLAEGPRRAVGHGADLVLAEGAGAKGREPQLLFRSRAARGLLGAAQVSPHDLGAACLFAAGSARGRRRGEARDPLGAASPQPSRARGRARRAGSVAAAAAAERLWTLNAVRVPDGVDEAAVRRRLLDEFSIEIGAGLGPLAGRIWRVGLMGAGSTLSNVMLFLTALERVLTASGHRPQSSSAAVTAAESAAATWDTFHTGRPFLPQNQSLRSAAHRHVSCTSRSQEKVMRLMRLGSVGLATIVATACATNPATGNKEFSLMSEAQEISSVSRWTHRCAKRWASTTMPSCSATCRTSECGWRDRPIARICRGTSPSSTRPR